MRMRAVISMPADKRRRRLRVSGSEALYTHDGDHFIRRGNLLLNTCCCRAARLRQPFVVPSFMGHTATLSFKLLFAEG